MIEHPHGRNAQIDHHLSNLASHYRPGGFVADRVFPVVEVPKQSDSYIVFENADLFRHENTRRARGGEANKVEFRLSNAQFYCRNYALKADVSIEDRANTDPLFIQKFEEGRVRRVQDALYLDWEMRLAGLLRSTGKIPNGKTLSGNKQWTDQTNADPLGDLFAGLDDVETKTGYRPNRALFSGSAWKLFRRHAKVINKMPSVSASQTGSFPSIEQAQTLLELNIIVANAWKNTADEALATQMEQVWQHNVLLYYAPERPSMETPSLGYCFRWSTAGLPNMQVERHSYDSRRHAYEVEIGYYQDEAVVATELGYFVRSVR